MNSGQALVEAMLYGKLDGLSEETLFLFARTGLVHLFSASGFHLWAAVLVATWGAKLTHSLFPPGRARNIWDFALCLALMLFFGHATDWSSPMVRAFVFAGLLAAAKLLENRPNPHWIFLLSLVGAAALGKGSTLSFLLSACGMAGVLYIQPRKAWVVALGPWLFTMPITIWCFGLFPLLSPLWNLTFGLAISWLVLPPAIISLVLAQFSLPTAWLDLLAAEIMRNLTAWLLAAANGAGLVFWVRPLPWLLLVAGLYASQNFWRKKRKIALATALSAFLAAIFFPNPDLSLLDVGQGDALLMRTAGNWTLSDVGPPGKTFSAPVTRSLEAHGIGEIGEIVLSHLDMDHSGGLASLVTRHKVRGHLWIRESALAEKNAQHVLLAAERAGVPVRFLTPGQAPAGWECWSPPFSKGNDSSPLCRVRTDGGRRALLTGDMGEKTEWWALQSLRPFPTAEVLKVAHHGSRFSSTDDFLRASGARLALISVGKRNRYGHPNGAVLERLQTSGMKVRRTDREGSVSLYWFSWPGFTEEITRTGATASRVKPGTPALTSREYADPAWVK